MDTGLGTGRGIKGEGSASFHLLRSILRITSGCLSLLLGAISLANLHGAVSSWDNFSDTWVATDGLGRRIPASEETGPPRTGRTVGIFYFLWHGAHVQGGPYDISRILGQDPAAMQKPDSPLWGPLHAPHHWGQSIFGYYRLRDDGVLRKHAQMLADAGVDVVIFDVSNQVTYRDDYLALLRVWSAVRAAGNRTPQVAFLAPFWDPAKAVRELWRDLYAPGIHRELWFTWDGRPLLLADSDLLDARVEFPKQDTPDELKTGHTLGQAFTAGQSFIGAGGRFPTWRTHGAAVTLSLHRDGPAGERLMARRFTDVGDNDWLVLRLTNALPAGRYYLEASEPSGRLGWWSVRGEHQPQGEALADGKPVPGDRTLRLFLTDSEVAAIRRFFTFRKPQPDYFQGQTRPDMWSWLEVYPQHVFTNRAGQKEQMSVGVAQNAVGRRLGSMSERGAFGRSRRGGAMDTRPGAVNFGFNFAEQAERALREDPHFVFITGWNEWIAGRFREFNGVREPVMFVDQFDQEHSRDIEPMQNGHGDNYYYQMASFIRLYKGTRPLPRVHPAAIQIDGRFDDWTAVTPEYRDTVDDPVRREAPGWDTRVIYRENSGRNDLIAAKVSVDEQAAAFLVQTRSPLTGPTGSNWMVLLVDVDANPASGWLGYDFLINRRAPGTVERHVGPGFAWTTVGTAAWKAAETNLELSVAWPTLGQTRIPPVIDFKWGDNLRLDGTWSDFTSHGDAAPNDRFNYRAVLR